MILQRVAKLVQARPIGMAQIQDIPDADNLVDLLREWPSPVERGQDREDLDQDLPRQPDALGLDRPALILGDGAFEPAQQRLAAPEYRGRLDEGGRGGHGERVRTRPVRANLPVAQQTDQMIRHPVFDRQTDCQQQCGDGRVRAERPARLGMDGEAPVLGDLQRNVGRLAPLREQDKNVFRCRPVVEPGADLLGEQPADAFALGAPRIVKPWLEATGATPPLSSP